MQAKEHAIFLARKGTCSWWWHKSTRIINKSLPKISVSKKGHMLPIRQYYPLKEGVKGGWECVSELDA